MASLTIRDLNKSFGSVAVLKGIDLEVKTGEFVVLVGPSGCGKSTLLALIAGLETVSSGEIRIGDRVVNGVPPKDRDIAMVFQSYALYPTMTARANITFGMESRGVPKRVRTEALATCRRAPANRKPAQSQALSVSALGRPAPARRHGKGARSRSRPVPVRRAALQS
jgi:multiple sugar transport system ATP-binding protein